MSASLLKFDVDLLTDCVALEACMRGDVGGNERLIGGHQSPPPPSVSVLDSPCPHYVGLDIGQIAEGTPQPAG